MAGTGVRFLQGWVTGLSPTAQQVTVRTARGEETLHYDTLLYTLGSRTDKDRVPGVREYALAVGDQSDGERLQQRLRDLAEGGYGDEVVVVGGGLTGIETATELAERYPALPVRLVTAGRWAMASPHAAGSTSAAALTASGSPCRSKRAWSA